MLDIFPLQRFELKHDAGSAQVLSPPFSFFLGGVAMVLQHRYFIQKILGTSTICSHGYGFDMP